MRSSLMMVSSLNISDRLRYLCEGGTSRLGVLANPSVLHVRVVGLCVEAEMSLLLQRIPDRRRRLLFKTYSDSFVARVVGEGHDFRTLDFALRGLLARFLGCGLVGGLLGRGLFLLLRDLNRFGLFVLRVAEHLGETRNHIKIFN